MPKTRPVVTPAADPLTAALRRALRDETDPDVRRWVRALLKGDEDEARVPPPRLTTAAGGGTDPGAEVRHEKSTRR
jgi:hypothetical protein